MAKKIIIPEEKMARYIKYVQDYMDSNIPPTKVCCPHCDKIVDEGPLYPYYYDKEDNDVYFASLCPECGGLIIGKE